MGDAGVPPSLTSAEGQQATSSISNPLPADQAATFSSDSRGSAAVSNPSFTGSPPVGGRQPRTERPPQSHGPRFDREPGGASLARVEERHFARGDVVGTPQHRAVRRLEGERIGPRSRGGPIARCVGVTSVRSPRARGGRSSAAPTCAHVLEDAFGGPWAGTGGSSHVARPAARISSRGTRPGRRSPDRRRHRPTMGRRNSRGRGAARPPSIPSRWRRGRRGARDLAGRRHDAAGQGERRVEDVQRRPRLRRRPFDGDLRRRARRVVPWRPMPSDASPTFESPQVVTRPPDQSRPRPADQVAGIGCGVLADLRDPGERRAPEPRGADVQTPIRKSRMSMPSQTRRSTPRLPPADPPATTDWMAVASWSALARLAAEINRAPTRSTASSTSIA